MIRHLARAFGASGPSLTSVHYTVQAHDAQLHLHPHLFGVTLSFAAQSDVTTLQLPVWIAGSYLVREFARHVQQITAQVDGRPAPLVQVDKTTWQVAAPTNARVTVTYQVYAFDNSVRTAFLDSARGFFNATSLCLQALGRTECEHSLTLIMPTDWRVATSLRSLPAKAALAHLPHPLRAPRGAKAHHFSADHYDELADSPVTMGLFWQGRFTVRGVEHQLVVTGAAEVFDSERLLTDTQRIVQAVMDFWHPNPKDKPPIERYVFMLQVLDDAYGGLEHRESTALIAARKDLPRIGQTAMTDGYVTLLGLISHEYFHTWNVKRLKPAAFVPYDLSQENYTELLWFFEGLTSYYDDLLLARAGVIDAARYVQLLSKTVQQVHQTPGRHVQSVAKASFDAWTKYYRPDENTINTTVSYYTKGALVGLCLDLQLRQEGSSLDALMRLLWQRLWVDRQSPAHQANQGALTEADVHAALQTLTRRDWQRELAAWVHGTADLPLSALLPRVGVAVKSTALSIASHLGLRTKDKDAAGKTGIFVTHVLSNYPAQAAGVAPGDEIIGLQSTGGQGWRLKAVDDIPQYSQSGAVRLLLSRDQRLLTVDLQLPSLNAAHRTQLPQLSIADAVAAQGWVAAQT